jgi:segregation and condensation protein B
MTNQADEPKPDLPADGPAPAQDGGTAPVSADRAAADSAAAVDPAAEAPDTPPESEAPDPALLAGAVRLAEALVYASDKPVTPAMIGAVLPEGLTAGIVMAALAEACEGRGVVLTEVAGGWAFRTAPDLAQILTKVVQAPRRLPRAAMEALSIIAYHQPCTRGEIEEIRGAALAQTTLEALLELGLVAPRGRREVPGRPTLWGTTPKFLEQFSLRAISDLPRKEELVTAETGPPLPLQGIRPEVEPPPDVEPSLPAESAPAADDPDATPNEEQDDPPAAPTGS